MTSKNGQLLEDNNSSEFVNLTNVNELQKEITNKGHNATVITMNDWELLSSTAGRNKVTVTKPNTTYDNYKKNKTMTKPVPWASIKSEQYKEAAIITSV